MSAIEHELNGETKFSPTPKTLKRAASSPTQVERPRGMDRSKPINSLIIEARTPKQLRTLAAELRTLADTLNQRAEALDRQQYRPVHERVLPKSPRAGQGRKPTSIIRFCRVDLEQVCTAACIVITRQ